MEFLPLILRVVLLSLSFFGLCAAAMSVLRLNRFIAPSFAACSVICILMFGGMLNVLKPAFRLLYFGGFAGFIYVYFIRHKKPDWLLIGIYSAFCAYLACRFRGSMLFIPDDFSHWGTAARYLLRFDAFPDSSTSYVTFQSYPLGATSFLYYVGRAIESSEPVWLAAQSMLQAILFLPLLAHIRGNRRTLLSAAAVFFLILYKFNRPVSSLTVDWLLSFFGFGGAAIILYYRTQPQKALLAALPCIVSALYIKSSGLFFSAVCIILLTCIVFRLQGKSAAIRYALIVSAITLAAYLAWTLHVKLSFPAGFDSKHAVSLSAYADKLRSKGLRRCLSIAWAMVQKWLKPEFYQVLPAVLMVLIFVSAQLTARRHPEMRKCRTALFRYLFGCIGCYCAWFAMLYAMYILSMPYAEAKRLASFSRYDSTGLLLMTGLALIGAANFYSRVEFRSEKRSVCAAAFLCATLLASAPLLSLGSEYPFYNTFYTDLVNKDLESYSYRGDFIPLHYEHDLPQGDYIVYYGEVDPELSLAAKYYAAKYELDSPGLKLALYSDSEEPWALYTLDGISRADTAQQLLDGQFSGECAVILMQENAEFSEAVENLLPDSNIQIIRAYP